MIKLFSYKSEWRVLPLLCFSEIVNILIFQVAIVTKQFVFTIKFEKRNCTKSYCCVVYKYT